MVREFDLDLAVKAWQRRMLREESARSKRALEARREAEVAARLLERFGATRVYLFGSLLWPGSFHANSDIDLACEGIPPALFLRASAEAARVTRFELDLIPLEDCRGSLKEIILRDGELLVETGEGGLP